jgi:hypothetical protein
VRGTASNADNVEMWNKIKQFITKALKDRKEKGRIILGKILPEAQARIADKISGSIFEIQITMDDVRHAHQEKHNLDADDLRHAVNVINTATDITLSERRHADNDVLVFTKDINGDLTFLTEVHIKNGYLQVFDFWRQKKVRNRPDDKTTPGANVQDVTPLSSDDSHLNSLSSNSTKLSSGN